MKIAIISSGFLPVVDGVTVTVLQRLKLLSDRGHHVLLICPDYSALEAIYPHWRAYTGTFLPNVEVVNLASTPFMDLEFERNLSRAAYPVLLKRLRQFQPEVIHVDEPERLFMGFLKIPAVAYAKQQRIPCTSFFHTNFIEYGEDYIPLPPIVKPIAAWAVARLFAWIYNAYDATLVASATTHRRVQQLGIRNAIHREFLGLDLSRFQPELKQPDFFERVYGLTQVDRTTKLIFLGRLTPDKGWRFSLDALPTLATRVDPQTFSILIAGDGELRQEILNALQPHFPHVYCLGRLTPDAIPALLINSDLHVTTSQKETRGLTVLEAMAAGIPVLAPRAGGVVDSIQEGWNGMLFEPNQAIDFLEKLQQLMAHPALRQEMGERGKASVATLGLETAIDHLIDVWKAQQTM